MRAWDLEDSPSAALLSEIHVEPGVLEDHPTALFNPDRTAHFASLYVIGRHTRLAGVMGHMRPPGRRFVLDGNAFVDHFGNSRLWEWREFQKSVSDWELKRYFEII